MKIQEILEYKSRSSLPTNEDFNSFLNDFLDIEILNEAKPRIVRYNPKTGRQEVYKGKPQKKSGSGLGLAAAGALALGTYGAAHMSQPAQQNYEKPAQVSMAQPQKDLQVHLYNPDGSEAEGTKQPIATPAQANKEIPTTGFDQFKYQKASPLAKDAEVKPFYKIGTPYEKDGVTYHPKYDPDYKKVGYASWYGPGFDGRLTANHDVFNTNTMTAAHPTLPIPSKVWVTNLENGKKVLVTINDRGPYAKGSLLDLSSAAANALGFKNKGSAKVKIQYDKEATNHYLKKAGLWDQFIKATTVHNKHAVNKHNHKR